ncbi:hypothetical protein [Lacticaseibacillus thailandensis]|uniref:Uncharacterized protein n=1 Tax=Lacticaseibacillus thailandensis DSM 22698 = JCM 13996 TaxID=1423810 RepID=A0A0R2C854_9LACO|nr:hypothetical protein [Lacticaseibacillus thailandensis]KRM87969.1 hypothetical protein FD19_GL000251 [Lacticaseibacillus thailandensis DSM 22698 = JCM 13996]
MKSFLGGFITGAVIAGAWALTHRQTAAAADRDAHNLTRVGHDAQHLMQAVTTVRHRTSALQQAIQDTVPAAEAGINDAITNFKFQTAPRIAKLTTSIDHITKALPESE